MLHCAIPQFLWDDISDSTSDVHSRCSMCDQLKTKVLLCTGNYFLVRDDQGMIGPTGELDQKIALSPYLDSRAHLLIRGVCVSLMMSSQKWYRNPECTHAVVVISIDWPFYDALGALPDYRWLHGENLMAEIGAGKATEDLKQCVICGPVPKMAVGFREIVEVSGA